MKIVKEGGVSMQEKLNYKRTFFVGLAFLSICAFWQMYDNIIPLILQNTFGLGETVTGGLMAMDNVLALFLLPLFGTLSDKTETPLGKRTPFILVGTVLAVCFMLLLPVADRTQNLVLFVGTLFATLVSMGLYRSPAVALMPDLTPNSLRSRANAVINLMGAVGGVYALIMIKVLVGGGERPDYTGLFLSIAGVMVGAVVILLLTVRENRLRREIEETEQIREKAAPDSTEKEIPCGLPREVKKSMVFMLLSIFFWFTAYNAVTTAFSRYTRVVWKMEGGSFANCLMVATVAAILSYIPIGAVSAKIGRKKTIMGGVLMMAVCYLAAVFVNEYHLWINIAFALIGIGWAAINVNSYPMIVAMSQGSDIGKYTGTYYTFSMAAQVVTPILSGVLLENVSYRTLFPYAFVFAVLAFCTMTQVRHGDVKPRKKESILEHFDVDD